VATAAVVGVVAFILGLGATLMVNGKSLGVPLPFAILRHVPVVQNLEAARFSLYLQFAAAIIFAVGLDRVRAWGWLPAPASAAPSGDATTPSQGAASAAAPSQGAAQGDEPSRDAVPAALQGQGAPVPRPGPRARPVVVAAVGLIALLPLLPHLPLPTAPTDMPGFFTSNNAKKIPSGAVALTLPFDLAPQNDPMMWQAASGMRFRILGGDAFVRNFDGRTTWHWQPAGPKVLLKVLRAGRYPTTPPPPMTQQAIDAVRQFITHNHVSVVLVDRTTRDGTALAVLMKYVLHTGAWQRGRMDVWLNVQRDLGGLPG
jgi:hypothetical protein